LETAGLSCAGTVFAKEDARVPILIDDALKMEKKAASPESKNVMVNVQTVF